MAVAASAIDDRLADFTTLVVVFSVASVGLYALHVVASVSMDAILWIGSVQLGLVLYALGQRFVNQRATLDACESAGDGSRD